MDIRIRLTDGAHYDLWDIDDATAQTIRAKYEAGQPFAVTDPEDDALLIIRPEHTIAIEIRADEADHDGPTDSE